MKEADLSQIKNDFSSFFQQIQNLINDNNRFKEIIEDYIDCKQTIDELTKKDNKKSKKLLTDYLVIQKELETEIYSQLKKSKSNSNHIIKRRM